MRHSLIELSPNLVLSTPAHQDSGFLTLLQTFHYPGLEIEIGGKWHRVSPPEEPNTLVVNLGEQMTQMSNGKLKATIHRVIDIGEDRCERARALQSVRAKACCRDERGK